MPSFIKIFGYNIYFWSNEGEPLEPIHVHISKEPHINSTKVWINQDGSCELESNNDQIPQKDLKKLLNVIEEYSDDIKDKWREIFKEEPTYHHDENPLDSI